MSEVHNFQAEVSQLLELVINSLYSHKDVFLRELVSNASDALDKLRFRAITEPGLMKDDEPLEIRILPDKETKTLTIEDTGIGMTHDELVRNLGTIAHSSTREFLAEMAKAGRDKLQLIGQFGVGFYAAFLVAPKVEVVSRAAGSDDAYRWISDAKGTFTIEKAERATRGTSVVLHLAEEHHGFLEPWRIKELVERYSDYVNQPIKLGDPKKDAREYETINRATALWQRPRGEIKDEQAHELYKHLTHDLEAPRVWTHLKAEGTQSFAALLFVPQAPSLFDLHLNAERGLRLYVKRVLVLERCEELLPQWLRFVQGVVDSDDLPLNVSREMLQDSALVRAIRKQVVRKITDRLKELADENAESYGAFWKSFGPILKEGLALDSDQKDRLLPLLRYESSHGAGLHSLADYAGRMKEDQKAIYYVLGSANTAAGTPHHEALAKRGYEVLFMTDPVDEWAVTGLREYEGKPLVNAMTADIDLPTTEEEKKDAEAKKSTLGPLLALMKEVLGERVQEVRVSERLVSSPVCLVLPKGAPTPLMERVLQERGAKVPKTKRILEVNAEHPLIEALRKMQLEKSSDPKLANMIELLHDQAVLVEGGRPEDPSTFAKRITDLLTQVVQGA